MPRSLIPLLLLLPVLLGFTLVVILLVRSIRLDVRQLRRGSAALQPPQDPPEQGRVLAAPAPTDPDSDLRRIAAIDPPGSIGTGRLPVAATIVVGGLAALVGVAFLTIGVVLWLFGGPDKWPSCWMPTDQICDPSVGDLAAWFTVIASLLVLAAYRSLKQVVGAWRRRGFVFVMDQVPG